MKSAVRRAQHPQHFAYPDEGARPARPDDAGYHPRAPKHRAHSAQPAGSDQKWAPRQTMLFIVGASVFLWAAIVWVSVHYL